MRRERDLYYLPEELSVNVFSVILHILGREDGLVFQHGICTRAPTSTSGYESSIFYEVALLSDEKSSHAIVSIVNDNAIAIGKADYDH